jgi:hypothetical protein
VGQRSKKLLAQMEVEEVLLWPELEHSTLHFGSMPDDIEFIRNPYCAVFECLKMENHSNLPAFAVEHRWQSAGTFVVAVRRTSFDSSHHAVQSLLAT